jgi:hypothetical protein
MKMLALFAVAAFVALVPGLSRAAEPCVAVAAPIVQYQAVQAVAMPIAFVAPVYVPVIQEAQRAVVQQQVQRIAIAQVHAPAAQQAQRIVVQEVKAPVQKQRSVIRTVTRTR